jgi:threonyl-tRNA synthetase
VREAEMEKVPYIVVIGEKEKNSGTVSVRSRLKGELGRINLEEFIQKLEGEIENKV